jgi:hypothetical protein
MEKQLSALWSFVCLSPGEGEVCYMNTQVDYYHITKYVTVLVS